MTDAERKREQDLEWKREQNMAFYAAHEAAVRQLEAQHARDMKLFWWMLAGILVGSVLLVALIVGAAELFGRSMLRGP